MEKHPQKLMEPENCTEYPWNVERFANSLKYLKPKLPLCFGNAEVTANPRALTAYSSSEAASEIVGPVLPVVCRCFYPTKPTCSWMFFGEGSDLRNG